jgi:hypothetical protein
MPNTIYSISAEAFGAALTSLSEILTKAAAHENAAALPLARLAPDMFTLSMQVQLSCFHAAAGTARLRGLEPAKFAAQELGFPALQALLTQTVQGLATLGPDDFAGAVERKITMPLQNGSVLAADGLHFLARWLLPNFYFHVVTAYDILRQHGLEIGKRDYLSHLGGFIQQPAA